MPKTRIIPLNGNAGPLISVLAQQCQRRTTAREDEAVPPTGIQYVRGDDTSGNLITVGPPASPDAPQIDLWQNMPGGSYGGKLQGIGPQTVNAATALFKAQGKTAAATTIRVTEYD